MLEHDSPLNDVLAAHLQSAIDKKLTIGEAVLMTLSGAAGEALAVTDRRVLLLREQMPILGGEAEIDCFNYPYDQISTVRVEDAVGGGHLKLVLITPPVDEKEVTLFFPPHVLNRFDTAAARIRLLAEQTRSVPVASPSPPAYAADPPSTCEKCGKPVEEGNWNFCVSCGASLGALCGFCEYLMPRGAEFCPRCGTSAKFARRPKCQGCGKDITPGSAFCPYCGLDQGERCQRCAGRIFSEWLRCPACGLAIDRGSDGRVVSSEAREGSEPRTAEEHNAVGRRLYEAENYAEAIAHFQTAIVLDPRNPLYHCNLGVVFSELNQDDAAIAEYNAAIALAPTDPTPYLNLGYFHAERDNDTEARAALEKVIEIAPGSAEAEEASQIIDSLHEV